MEIKRTSKGIIALIIGLGVLFCVGVVALFIFIGMNFDAGVYTKFDFGITGDVVINNKVEITEVTDGIYKDKYYIQGYLKNISNSKFEDVTVEYTLYDKDGVVIDKISSRLTDLAKDKQWKFHLEYDAIDKDEIAKYELSKVTFY